MPATVAANSHSALASAAALMVSNEPPPTLDSAVGQISLLPPTIKMPLLLQTVPSTPSTQFVAGKKWLIPCIRTESCPQLKYGEFGGGDGGGGEGGGDGDGGDGDGD